MNRKRRIFCNIGFALLCTGLFYLLPYGAWHTMEGDKEDILLGMVFGFVPLGLLLLSALYGLCVQGIIAPICIASALSVPAVFIPVMMGGATVATRVQAVLTVFVPAVLVTGLLGAVPGWCIRWLCQKLVLWQKRREPVTRSGDLYFLLTNPAKYSILCLVKGNHFTRQNHRR